MSLGGVGVCRDKLAHLKKKTFFGNGFRQNVKNRRKSKNTKTQKKAKKIAKIEKQKKTPVGKASVEPEGVDPGELHTQKEDRIFGKGIFAVAGPHFNIDKFSLGSDPKGSEKKTFSVGQVTKSCRVGFSVVVELFNLCLLTVPCLVI